MQVQCRYGAYRAIVWILDFVLSEMGSCGQVLSRDVLHPH